MRTRDGREVRIFCRDGGATFPVMGCYRNGEVYSFWHSYRWKTNGEGYSIESSIHPDDLPEFQAAIAGDRWRPIAQAPKNGAEILLWSLYHGHVAGWWDDEEVGWVSNAIGRDDVVRDPTHWLPLPPPPEAS